MEVKGKRFSVIGGGVSGCAVSKLLHRHGGTVFLSEKADFPVKQNELESLAEFGIDWEIGQHTTEKIVSADAIIVSPGVSPTASILLAAMKRDVPFYSEIEVGYWFCSSPIIAVTGTNGKTTVITLLGEMLLDYGIRAVVAGNIGAPFSDVADQVPNPDVFVLELSSYQLERISTFHAQTAVILNITPDHMERYRDMDDYAQTKFRITLNQTCQDYCIYNLDDPETAVLAKKAEAKCIPYSLHEIRGNGVWMHKGGVHVRMDGKSELLLSCDQIKLPGEHNISNVMACAAAAHLAGIPAQNIGDTVQKFRGIEHRIEFVLSLHGRTFYNDSKGTNVNATEVALKTVRAPVILIAGGKDKNTDLSPLNDLIRSKVKLVILLGEAAERMEEMWDGVAPLMLKVDSMQSAVQEAWAYSQEGDTILLSPACSSFDMFANFEERGEIFKSAVHKLARGEKITELQ